MATRKNIKRKSKKTAAKASAKRNGSAKRKKTAKQKPAVRLGPDDFAKNVKRLREGLGLTQGQLAEKLDWRQPRIAQIECGTQDRRISTIQKMAKALGVEPFELFEEAMSEGAGTG